MHLFTPFLTQSICIIALLSTSLAEEKPIHLANTGWHVGIILPVDNVLKRNLPETRDFPEAKYLEIGWGDRRFYQSNDPSMDIAVGALFTATPSVVHVYGFKKPVEAAFSKAETLKLEILDKDYSNLLRFIYGSFVRNANGAGRSLGKGLYEEGTSQFYEGTGNFHLFNTCNTWVADALKVAGFNINAQGIITANNLMEQARQTAKRAN